MGKAALVGCVMVVTLLAQDSAPTSRPESRAVREFTLDNGLRVRQVPVDLPGEVAVILGIRGAGILAEPPGIPHLAHISEHTIFYSGSEHRDVLLDWFGSGRANAETLPDLMYFDLSPGPAEINRALSIQRTRLFEPDLDPIVLDRERPVALSEVTGLEGIRNERNDFLGKFAWSAFVQVAIHGITEVPFRARTEAITAKDVREFYERTFSPNHAMLTIVGDVDPGDAKRLDTIRSSFWSSAIGGRSTSNKQLPESRPTLKAGSFKGSWDVASHQFFMVWPVPPPSDPAHPALSVLAQLLNVRLTMSSDIVKLTRRPALVNPDVGGLFAFQAPLKTKDGGDALAAEFQKLIDSLALEDSSLRALKAFKANVRASAGLGPVDYPPNIPQKIKVNGTQELWRMRATFAWNQSPEDYCKRVDAVTAEDIRAAIKKFLTPAKATIVTITGKE